MLVSYLYKDVLKDQRITDVFLVWLHYLLWYKSLAHGRQWNTGSLVPFLFTKSSILAVLASASCINILSFTASSHQLSVQICHSVEPRQVFLQLPFLVKPKNDGVNRYVWVHDGLHKRHVYLLWVGRPTCRPADTPIKCYTLLSLHTSTDAGPRFLSTLKSKYSFDSVGSAANFSQPAFKCRIMRLTNLWHILFHPGLHVFILTTSSMLKSGSDSYRFICTLWWAIFSCS